jgi:RNA polymerase sigma-70 factor (ECF subfamily)
MENQYLLDADVVLMLKFQKGDKLAFSELLDKYKKQIINFIYRMIQDRTEADDLAQEVFIKVYNCAHSYSPKAKFSTWIYTIAKNVCLNELRKKKPVSLDENIATEDGVLKREFSDVDKNIPSDDVVQNELQEIVKGAIGSLPETQRMAVVLRRYDQLSYEDIAKTMGCSVSAVKSLLNRAKESLKEKLSPYILLKK